MQKKLKSLYQNHLFLEMKKELIKCLEKNGFRPQVFKLKILKIKLEN